MSDDQPSYPHLAAVIGAGPAGLFAARELAEHGNRVFLFNRDIKPGGLAEYGIYPSKLKMKEGLRAQFRQVLDMPGVSYIGNILVGEHGDLTLADLREMGFQAILAAVGAQGTKWLGLPGEDLEGVYHAKDVVYHYNGLPPYSKHSFITGRRAAVVGMGNVMMDISRWLLEARGVDEVVALGRRGPAEVKFDRKELETIASFLDLAALHPELERITPLIHPLGQDPAALLEQVNAALVKAAPAAAPGKLRLEFLSSPTRMVGDERGRVCALELEDTMLVVKNGDETTAVGLGTYRQVEVDTVIFAIGDQVDSDFGLPVKGTEFVKTDHPRYPIDGSSFEVCDPQCKQIVPDVFVAGWARKTSSGLVGVARRDGINAARAMQQYLATLPPCQFCEEAALEWLARLGKPLVTRADLARLEQVEHDRAVSMGEVFFKFDNNEDMLQAMGLIQGLPR